MIKSVSRFVEVAEPVVTICDVCKKEFDHGCTEDAFEIEEFTNISFTGGYGSIFGDGTEVKIDICQSCFRNRLGGYVRLNEEAD